MNNKELMLNDWVLHNGKPKKVCVIWGREVSLIDPTETWGTIYQKFHEEELQPIPLTKEILEKNNFESDEYVCWTGFGKDNEYDVELTFYDIDNHVDLKVNGPGCYYSGCNIQYVHELQHLLTMVGYEKEINP